MRSHRACFAQGASVGIARRGWLFWWLGLAVAEARTEAAVAQRRFDIPAFDSVQIDVACDVRLFPAKTAGLTAKAAPNVLQALQARVSANTLHITAGSFQTGQPIELSIGYQTLSRLVASAAGQVQLQGPTSGTFSLVVDGGVELDGRGLNVSALNVDSRGGGSVRLSGTAKRQVIALQGAGDYHAFDLGSQVALVNLEGAGDVELTVSSTLEVVLEGAGSVRYRGAARVKRRGDGAGTVQQLSA